MTTDELKELTRAIVAEARRLSAEHATEPDAPVNYACIFAQGSDEYDALIMAAKELGPVVHDTAMGPVFLIAPLSTEAGTLRLLKIRRQDPKRPERGDADFTVPNYEKFKAAHLGKPGWRIIRRPEMEMLELADPAFSVLAYYSHPTLGTVLKLNI